MAGKIVDSEDLFNALRNDYNINGANLARVKRHIDAAPAVDAVEVVRCKDCKHFVDGDTCFNNQWWNDDFFTYVKEDDFCSYGERREGE